MAWLTSLVVGCQKTCPALAPINPFKSTQELVYSAHLQGVSLGRSVSSQLTPSTWALSCAQLNPAEQPAGLNHRTSMRDGAVITGSVI